MEKESKKEIHQITDLELARILQREYEQIIRSQGIIIMAEKEIQKRETRLQQSAKRQENPDG